MKPDIQISQLKTLIAIDEEGSFSAASKRVGRTQSAVTQQMKNLEQIVGMPLFVAKGRQRQLTEAGLTLLRNGHEIISLCNQAVAASQKSLATGTVRIGAPLEIAEELLPRVLKNFAGSWPGTRVIIHVDRSPKLMQMLENGQLDMTMSTRRSGNYKSALLLKLPALWIAAESWKFNQSEPIPLVLSDEPSMFRRIALSSLDLSGQTYVERLTSSSLAGVRLAVVAELGITVRTKSSFFTNTRILTEKDGLPSLPDIPYYLHRSVQNVRQECIDLFEIIEKQAAELN